MRSKISGRILIFLILMISVSVMGTAHAAWNSVLNIQAKLTTDTINVLFSDSSSSDKVSAVLEKTPEPLEVQMDLAEDKKTAQIRFPKGLPLDKLAEGDSIKIEFPLAAEQGTLNLFRDLKKSEKAEPLTMKAGRDIQLFLDGKWYKIKDPSASAIQSFHRDLKFDLYREVEQKDRKLVARVYLQLTEDSQEDLRSLQNQPLQFKMEDLEEMSISGLDADQNGIRMSYSAEIPLYIEQKGGMN